LHPEAEQIFLEGLMIEMKKRLGGDDKRKKVEFFSYGAESTRRARHDFCSSIRWFMKGNLVLNRNEGGCSTAYTTKSAIYIPSTKHRMGINVDANKTMGPSTNAI